MAIERTFRPDDGKRLPWRPGAARTEHHEPASGLRLRVAASGARSWAVAYWSASAKTARRFKLGDAATMPLAQARKNARRVLHAVEHEGGDPQADRVAAKAHEAQERKRRAEERARQAQDRARRRIGFGTMCAQYIHERATKPSGRFGRVARRNTIRNCEGMLRNHVGPIVGDRAPEEMRTGDFRRLIEHAVEHGGPTMGARVRDFVSAVWRWVEQRPDDLGVKLPASSPLTGLPRAGVVNDERDRVLTPAEIWRFWRATEDAGLHGEALRFSLLTACRVNEAVELLWPEVSMEEKIWRLRAARAKGCRDRLIPLSPQALALLHRAEGEAEGERVFGKRRRLFDTVLRIRTTMGGQPWEARDLRRTAATLCARLGADPFVIALVLGHVRADVQTPAVTATYLIDRHDYSERVREALDRLGAWVEDTVSRATEPRGDVVAFERRA